MSRYALLGLLAAIALLPLSAAAAPDEVATSTITQSDGAFVADKRVEVFADTNADDPFPGDGRFSYVYTLTNDPTSALPLIGFKVEVVAECPPATIGFIAATGVEPDTSGAVVGAEVEWNFTDTPIQPGQTSAKLYITSECAPSETADAIVSVNGTFNFSATGVCLAPRVPPEVVGEPLPCTIGFWKNRAQGRKGLLQFFPDPEFGNLVTDAVALSNGVFLDEADLLTHLTSKGRRTTQERAKQQTAALLLNLAAGDAFPDNQKCKLFEGNDITANACGDNLSVGVATDSVLSDVLSSLEDDQRDAGRCADDINNGIGVVQ